MKSQPPSDRKSAPCLETPRTGSPTGGKRKKRMRKGRPQEDGAPAPSLFIIPPTDPSLLIYTANSSPAVARLPLLHRTAVPAQRGGRSGATGWPFRRNGITVPARRHHRSGATGWASRRNGITVPAQRHHRSGATASPFRRDGVHRPARGGKTAAQDITELARHEGETSMRMSGLLPRGLEKSSARRPTTLAFCRAYGKKNARRIAPLR